MSFDFDAAVSVPFRMQPGLRRLAAAAAQLTPSIAGGAHLRAKLAVLGACAGDALLASETFDARPAVDALLREAAATHPQALTLAGEAITAAALGWSLRGERPVATGTPVTEVGAVLAALPAPWRAPALIALAFEEDFAIVDGATGSIPWLAVCLPSHWSPRTKLGLGFADVHAPVADGDLLRSAGEQLVKLVCGAERWERFVWTLTPHAGLDAHPQRVVRLPWPLAASDDELARSTFLRSERQTFIPLPAHRQAIFTIRIGVQPLSAVAGDPSRARRLADALASMSDAVLDYRGLTGARDRLVAWLRERARAA